MKIEEFEQMITDKAHKSDILRLVNDGIELAEYSGEKAEEWYDYCAKLYVNSANNYENFKLNMANRLCEYRYWQYLSELQIADDKKENEAFYKVLIKVQQYATQVRQSCYNDKSLINDITKVALKYERYKNKLQNAISEQEDCKVIIKLSKGGICLNKISFITKIKSDDLSIKSEKALKLFHKTFIQFFKDCFMTETDFVKVLNNIKACKNANKRLLHWLIHEIYVIFAKANKTDFSADIDTYKIGEERKGKFASLKSDISIWIFDLLLSLGYLDDVEDAKYKTHEEKKWFIRDRMKEFSKHKWDDLQFLNNLDYNLL